MQIVPLTVWDLKNRSILPSSTGIFQIDFLETVCQHHLGVKTALRPKSLRIQLDSNLAFVKLVSIVYRFF